MCARSCTHTARAVFTRALHSLAPRAAMASLKDVIERVPPLATAIDQLNELAPGVAASAENLAALLEHLKKAREITFSNGSAEPQINLFFCRRKKETHISVRLDGPLEAWGDRPYHMRAWIAEEAFPCDGNGLLSAIVWARDAQRRLRDEGVCPCKNADGGLPKKRLKLKGMPKCARCVLKDAVTV